MFASLVLYKFQFPTILSPIFLKNSEKLFVIDDNNKRYKTAVFVLSWDDIKGRAYYSRTHDRFQPGKFITRRSGSGDAQFNYSRNFEMQGEKERERELCLQKRMRRHNAPRNDKLNRFPLGVVSSVTTIPLFWGRGHPPTYECEIILPLSTNDEEPSRASLV